MTTTPKVELDYLAPGQSQAEVTVNEAFNLLDAFVGGRSAKAEQNTPPGSPAEGDVYLVDSSPTGAWAGQAGKIAFYYNGWHFLPLLPGFKIYLETPGRFQYYNGTDWIVLVELGTGGDLTVSENINLATESGLTADSNGTQADALQLSATKSIHEVSTVASSGHAVKLPSAAIGQLHAVANHGSNELAVFPANGHQIARETVDASITIPVGKTVVFLGITSSKWAASEALGAGSSPFTPSIFTAKGELIVGDGSGTSAILGVPGTSAKRLRSRVSMKSDGGLEWRQPVFLEAAPGSNPTPGTIVGADGNNWYPWDPAYVLQPANSAISYDAAKGLFILDASVDAELAGTYLAKAYFTCLGSTHRPQLKVQTNYASFPTTFGTIAEARTTQAGENTIYVCSRFIVLSGQITAIGVTAPAGTSGFAITGSGGEQLLNRLIITKEVDL